MMSEIYSDDASLGQYLQINKPHKKWKMIRVIDAEKIKTW